MYIHIHTNIHTYIHSLTFCLNAVLETAACAAALSKLRTAAETRRCLDAAERSNFSKASTWHSVRGHIL